MAQAGSAPETERMIVRYQRGGQVEIGCSACGATDLAPTDSTAQMLRMVQTFVDAHAACVFSWQPVSRS